MRVFKAFFLIFIFTVIALVYVHQQVELVKLSYAIETKEKRLAVLLDHREKLIYNVDHLTSPSRMEKMLARKNVSVEYPNRDRVIRVANLASTYSKGPLRFASAAGKKNIMNNLLEVVGMGREAQAKEK